MDRWTNGRMKEKTDGQTDGRTDTVTYRIASTRLKIRFHLRVVLLFLPNIPQLTEASQTAEDIIIVGNKRDLDSERQVTKEDRKHLKDKTFYPVYEVSAKSGDKSNLCVRKNGAVFRDSFQSSVLV